LSLRSDDLDSIVELYTEDDFRQGLRYCNKNAGRCLIWVVCHEHRRSKRRCVTIREMKEGPWGSAIRSLIPSHRKLLWTKSMVVSIAERRNEDPGRHGRERRTRMLYDLIPMMPEPRLRPLVERFGLCCSKSRRLLAFMGPSEMRGFMRPIRLSISISQSYIERP
jgi:hypothetical protein